MGQLDHTNMVIEKMRTEVMNLLQFCWLVLELVEPRAPCVPLLQIPLLAGDDQNIQVSPFRPSVTWTLFSLQPHLSL